MEFGLFQICDGLTTHSIHNTSLRRPAATWLSIAAVVLLTTTDLFINFYCIIGTYCAVLYGKRGVVFNIETVTRSPIIRRTAHAKNNAWCYWPCTRTVNKHSKNVIHRASAHCALYGRKCYLTCAVHNTANKLLHNTDVQRQHQKRSSKQIKIHHVYKHYTAN